MTLTTNPAELKAAAARMQQLDDELTAARQTIDDHGLALDQARLELSSEQATSAALRAQVAKLTRAAEAQQVNAARRAAQPAAGKTTYPTLRHWVDGWLLGHIERDIGTRLRWCSRWHEHPEAVWRLDSLWADWERMYAEPISGASNWSRNSLGHHLYELIAASGPFSACAPHSHEPARTLPTTDWTTTAAGRATSPAT